ncbi:MAG: ASCH domain-containing protein [Bacteroidota bacterium]
MARLAPLVQDGRKRQTVRRERKHPIRPGDRLLMYTGQRTRKAQKLMETTCSRVENFCMDEHGRIILGLREPIEDARILGPEEAEAFARADGLGVDGSTAYDDLHGFLLVNYGLPFEGVVIYW